MKKSKLSIIIVSYNTSNLLQKCLKTLYNALDYSNLTGQSEVIVVDNASTDDSYQVVKRNFSNAHLIANKKNLGFAVANNQALRLAQGKYILLLNSDTQLKEEALTYLLNTAKKAKNIGVVGGKLLNLDGRIQSSVGFFPNLGKVFAWMLFFDDILLISSFIKPYHVEASSFYEKSQNVDWVSGACMLIKRGVLPKVGLLDERIFMYGEEVEWCFRIKKAGYRVVYQPEAEVFHSKGASSKLAKLSGITDEFGTIIFFYRKHKPYWQLFIVRLFLIFGALLRIFLFGIIVRNLKKASLYAKALEMVRR